MIMINDSIFYRVSRLICLEGTQQSATSRQRNARTCTTTNTGLISRGGKIRKTYFPSKDTPISMHALLHILFLLLLFPPFQFQHFTFGSEGVLTPGESNGMV